MSDRVFGYGTVNRIRKMLSNTRMHHQKAVELSLKRKSRVRRSPVVGSFNSSHSAPISPTQSDHRGESGATMKERVLQRLQSSFQRRNSVSGVLRRSVLNTTSEQKSSSSSGESLPSFKEIETNVPDSSKQALLLLRVRSKELENMSQNKGFGRRQKETLEFAAKNTGRLLLRNLEKMEENRDEDEDSDLNGGFDSLTSMMMESKHSFFSAMSSRSSKGPAAHRLRRMKKEDNCRVVSSSNSQHPHYNRKSTLAALWGSQKRN